MTITPITYSIDGSDRIQIEKREADKWVVVDICVCSLLNKHNTWEWETSPSYRTDEFRQRTRFDSLESALKAYEKFIRL